MAWHWKPAIGTKCDDGVSVVGGRMEEVDEFISKLSEALLWNIYSNSIELLRSSKALSFLLVSLFKHCKKDRQLKTTRNMHTYDVIPWHVKDDDI